MRRAAPHQLVKSLLPWAETETAELDEAERAAGRRVRLLLRGGALRVPAARRDGDAERPRKRPRHEGGGAVLSQLFDASLPLLPPPETPFTSFVLAKENVDTHAALAVLGSLLRLPPRSLGVAGTKDKRGVTAQRVTVPRLPAARVAQLNARLVGMRVGGTRYVPAQLGLGQLQGNAFTLTLRDVAAQPADVAHAVRSLQHSGFLNFFGLQRFGASADARTHRVGALLLTGRWEESVALLMAPRSAEREDMRSARAAWSERRDAAAALALLPTAAAAERAIMAHFAGGRGEPDYIGALKRIPKTLRMMYVHAWQSWLWNHAAAHRAQAFGLECAVEGDLVLCDGASAELQTVGDEGGEGEGEAQHALPRVRHVTAEEGLAKSVPITQVLLPLPAAAVLYPLHSSGDVYARLAQQEGVSLVGCQHSVREFSLSAFAGGYRSLLHRPQGLSFRLLRYSEPDCELTQTQLGSVLQAEGRRPVASGVPPPAEQAGFAGGEPVEGEGLFLGLQLCFRLPPSCYATMLVRELLKESTASAHHKGLSAAGAGRFAAAAAAAADALAA
jgi:tRNA pseudouridine13 synthase